MTTGEKQNAVPQLVDAASHARVTVLSFLIARVGSEELLAIEHRRGSLETDGRRPSRNRGAYFAQQRNKASSGDARGIQRGPEDRHECLRTIPAKDGIRVLDLEGDSELTQEIRGIPLGERRGQARLDLDAESRQDFGCVRGGHGPHHTVRTGPRSDQVGELSDR